MGQNIDTVSCFIRPNFNCHCPITLKELLIVSLYSHALLLFTCHLETNENYVQVKQVKSSSIGILKQNSFYTAVAFLWG